MSVNYYAYAVIGCGVPMDDLYKERQIPHVGHHVPSGAKFCPTCGKPAEITIREPIFNEDSDTLGGFTVWWGTDRKYAVIGDGASTGSSNGGEEVIYSNVDWDRIGDLKAQLKEMLSAFGLWDESKFGLYAILYCSY